MKPMPRIRVVLAATLATVLLTACGTPEDRKAEYLEDGRQRFAAGDYDKARVLFKNVLQIDGQDVEARWMLGQVFERLGDIKAAAANYRAVVALDPEHGEARERLGLLYLLGGAPDRALELAEDMLAEDPEHAVALVIRGGVRARAGDMAAATADAERAYALAPGDSRVVSLLSSLRLDAGRNDEAVEILKGGIAASPKKIGLHTALAAALLRAERPAQAIEVMEGIIRLEPAKVDHRLRLAGLYNRLHRLEDAEMILRQAVTDIPGELRLKLTLAEVVQGRSGVAAAEAELKGFLQAEPGNHDLRTALAALYRDDGRPEEAKALYQEIIAADGAGPKGLEARILLAELFINEDDRAAGRALLEEVLASNPKDAKALLLRGGLSLAERDAPSAISDFRTALRAQPDSPTILTRLAAAYLANGDTALAMENLGKVIDLDPRNVPARVRLAALHGARGQAHQAENLVRKGLAEAPEAPRLLETLFQLQSARGNWDGALATAERINAVRGEDGVGPYLLGLALQGKGQHAAALREFELALKVAPASVKPLTGLVRSLLALERGEEAVARLRQVVEAHPDSAIAHNLLGEVHLVQRDFDAAAVAFRKGIELDPAAPGAYRSLALSHLGAGDRGAALRVYEDAVATTGGAPQMRLVLAGLYEAEGRYEEAIAEHEALYAASPESDTAANNLAMVLAAYRSDRESLERAWELTRPFADTDNPTYLDTIGWVLFRRGQVAEAVPYLDRAAAALPDNAVVRYHAGMANHAAGDLASAREHLEKAVSGRQRFPQFDEAQALLASIVDS